MPSLASPPSATASRSGRGLWAKLGLAVAAPVLFFVLLEFGLVLGGVGRNTDFFIPDEQPGVYRTNPRFTELFFPASFGLKPLNFRITREKPAGTRRVFVLGESAAMGVPEPAFSVAPLLQAQLRAACPGERIEVFNLGVTAINSHAIRRIVRQAVEFQPDLLVVYLGNNEVVGPYGASSVVDGGTPPLALIRASLWVRSTRTGQLLQRLLGALRPAATGFRDWRGMEMFAGKTVGADDPRLAPVYANFTANLADILAEAGEAGIKTVLSTVAVNVRDSAPFASLAGAGSPEGIRAELELAADALVAGDPAAAEATVGRVLAAVPHHADSHYQLARLREAAGDLPAARTHYLEALQQDALRFRADARINQIIRTAAGAAPARVTLVDASRELGSDARSTAAPAGDALFFEHVHFRWEGNAALARLLAPAVATGLFGAGPPPEAWLDATALAAAVGYTGLGRLAMLRAMEELTQRPPFTSQSSYAADRTRLATRIAAAERELTAPGALAAAANAVAAAQQRDPDNPTLLFQAASARLQAGDAPGALALHERLAALVPPAPELAVQKAVLLQQLGRANEAEEVLLRAVATAPYYFQTYGFLASFWVAAGQQARAVAAFGRFVEKMPDSRAVRSAYAQLLAHSGDAGAAEREWRAVLRLVPDDESALAPLVDRLEQAGREPEAVELMLAAHAYNPRSFDNNARLVQVHEERGDRAQTVRFMRDLAASGPVNARLYVDLAVHLDALGRPGEALAALRRARQAAAGDAALAAGIEEMIRRHGQ